MSDADTSESPAVKPDAETRVGTPIVASPEGQQSPADAERAAQGRPEEPPRAPLQDTAVRQTPEGTGPGGEVRGGYGVGATGPGGDTDVRGPSETGGAGGGQSPLDAQRRADEEQDDFAQRPHLYVAGAFVGGFVFAQLLKRLGGGGD